MFQALGPLGSAPSVLIGLLALAAVLLVGRFLMNVAWKLVIVALALVSVVWVLGMVGMPVGIL